MLYDLYSEVFLSTPSARRATDADGDTLTVVEISIHALREEGDIGSLPPGSRFTISIHALREEGDGPAGRTQPQADDFYPRPPRGGRRAQSVARAST